MLPQIVEATGVDRAAAGVLAAAFPVGFAAALPLVGWRLCRDPYRRILRIGLAVVIPADLLMGAVDGYLPWLALRALQGAGAAAVWMALFVGVLRLWPHAAGRRLGGIVAAYGVGGIAGPLLGAVGGIGAPFALLGLACAVTLAATALLPAAGALPAAGPLLLTSPLVLAISAANVALGLAIGTLEGAFPLVFATRLDARGIGLLFLAATVPLILAAVFAGRIRGASPIRKALVATLAAGGVAVAAVPLAEGIAVWAALLVVAGLSVGTAETTSATLLQATLTADHQLVPATFTWTLGFIVGYGIGPPVAGLLARYWSPAASGLLVLLVCTGLAGAMAVVRLDPLEVS